MSREAVILAGGKGTRLRPYTVSLPKPLMPIGEFPIMEVLVRQISRCGFSKIHLAVNHQADIIKAYFQDGKKWGIEIDYSLEDRPLSTMGPLKLINNLPEDFMVLNGDILTDLDFSELYRSHVENGNRFTISAAVRSQKIDFGVLQQDKTGKLLAGFKEKPVNRYLVSMGIYMVNRSLISKIPDDQAYGFDDLMLSMLEQKQDIMIREHRGYWLDIGRPDDYAQAIDDFDGMRDRLNLG